MPAEALGVMTAGHLDGQTQEGCSATCCPELSVTLVGKCRDPHSLENMTALHMFPPTARGHTRLSGPVGTWGSQTRGRGDRTKFTHLLPHQMFIKICQAHRCYPLGAYRLGDGQETGNHKVVWDGPGEVVEAAPSPSGLALGAGKTLSRSTPRWVSR